MNFAEQLAKVAEESLLNMAKIAANNLSSKLIEAAGEGLFKLELSLSNITTDDEKKNNLAISREFTELLENELDGVRVRGELREEKNIFGITYKRYFWILEWD